jgi:hypothetical protein
MSMMLLCEPEGGFAKLPRNEVKVVYVLTNQPADAGSDSIIFVIEYDMRARRLEERLNLPA